MPMPFPDPIIRTRFLMKPNTNVMLPNRHRLTRIGFEGIGLAAENDPDDVLLELGFFFGELGLVLVVIVFIAREIGGVEEKFFEGLREEGVVRWGSDLEPAHEGLEHEVVEVGGVGEGVHGGRLGFGFGFGFGLVCRVLRHRPVKYRVFGFWGYEGENSCLVRVYGFKL